MSTTSSSRTVTAWAVVLGNAGVIAEPITGILVYQGRNAKRRAYAKKKRLERYDLRHYGFLRHRYVVVRLTGRTPVKPRRNRGES